MQRRTLLVGAAALVLSGQALSQQYNPRLSWQDSYAVDGVCYCNSNGFDHGADRLMVDTPAGRLSVPQVCSDIKDALGVGRSSGRIPYNDVQCGNGPPNNAGDEDPDACPGRVDIGSAGCFQIGPEWDLDAVYGGTEPEPAPEPAPEPVAEPTKPTPADTGLLSATATNNAGDARFAIDGDLSTRWTTRTPQRPDQAFVLDLGEITSVSSVTLNSQNSDNDDPQSYSLSLSIDGENYEEVAAGSGTGGITTIDFDSQRARFIGIIQTGSKSRNWWSIHELEINSDSNGSGSSVAGGSALDRSNWLMVASTNNRDISNAIDGRDGSRWTTFRQPQTAGQYFEIDLQSTEQFSQIVLDSSGSNMDFPREFTVEVSENGNNWTTAATGAGDGPVTSMSFTEQNARYIRIEQNGSDSFYWWSIHEVNVLR